MTWTLLPVREFTQHSSAWSALHAEAGLNPALDPEFVALLLQHFATDQEVLAVQTIEGRPSAMTIITNVRPLVWQTFQPSQAPLGLWLADGREELETRLRSLAKALPGYALLLGLTQIDPDIVPRPAHTSHLRTVDYIDTARISVAGSFEQYWEARSKNLRHNVQRQMNKLRRESIETECETLTDPEQVQTAIEEYSSLESAGWKANRGTAIHAENEQGRFYRSLLESFMRRGRGRIYRYAINGQVAASDLCIEGGDVLIILKTTYDEQIKGLSPAFLMRHAAFQSVFSQDAPKRIEFYGRVMDWHTKWTDEIRTLYHVNFYRVSLLARLRDRAIAKRG